MVKLIASDLDGTLLPPSKIMPEETFPLVNKMKNMGIVFVPASGRQLPNLKQLFAPVLGDIAIIAENGGLAWYNGDIIYSNPTPYDELVYALEIIGKEEGLFPLLSGVDCAYYASDEKKFIEVVNRSYSRSTRVDDLYKAAKEHTILKISVWDINAKAGVAADMLKPKIKGLRTKVSGLDWLDVCKEGADKGQALTALLNYLKIDKNDSVAFGDHMNDLEMLQASGKAYITANAFPGLKKYIPDIIPSNAEYGVITKIKELIEV